MRKVYGIVLFFLLSNFMYSQRWSLDSVGKLPDAITNNAVCEAVINDTTYIYSFCGIDSTKIYSGINLKSFRFNTISNRVEVLPNVPDIQGKIASGASRLGNKIYIIGGYHVMKSGSEVSSNKVHIFDIIKNDFIEDGSPIPIPIDDQVQVVWKDSLIYVITGWSNSSNVRNVQIYNPQNDAWTIGESVPNSQTYKSFGASGFIVDNTIYYFGGAQIARNFPIQNYMRKGVIDPTNPKNIAWSITSPNNGKITGYRMASINSFKGGLWIGGSNVTYNYDGIAYKDMKGVNPSNLIYELNEDNPQLVVDTLKDLPMDLRGIGRLNDSTFYLIGGMELNQKVSRKILKLTKRDIYNSIHSEVSSNKLKFVMSPNPSTEYIYINRINKNDKLSASNASVYIYNSASILVKEMLNYEIGQVINLVELGVGQYHLLINVDNERHKQKFVIIK